MGRALTGNELQEVLNIKHEDINLTLLKSYFIPVYNKVEKKVIPPRFSVTDHFLLPKGICAKNLEGMTRIGIYLFNRYIIEPDLVDVVGYINNPITGKVLENAIEAEIATACFTDKIDTPPYKDYLDKIQWYGGNDVACMVSPSLTPGILKPAKGLNALKKKLIQENKEEIDKGNPIVASKIEKELVGFAEKALKNDPGYDNFASKAKASVGNNYKTMNIMKGPLLDTVTGGYKVATGNYDEGIPKEQYSMFGDSAVLGATSRALSVAKGGYLASRTNQTMSAIKAGEKDSDCGTKTYLTVTIPKGYEEEYLYRYIIEGKKLIRLDSDNISNYVGKEVKMRSVMFCKHEEPGFCNKCLGDQPYLIGLENFGLAISRLSNTLLNANLKKFHDLTVKTTTVDIDKLFHKID